MSTALAIGATTRVLAQVIEDNINAAGIGLLGAPPHVVSDPPDQLETGAAEPTQLSLFLYHVTLNQGWRQVGLPSRNAAGAGIDRPPLALDLHYLLSAYGPGGYLPQMLLGLGMQALHETPFLARAEINSTFAAAGTPIDGELAGSELAEQVELIKVAPEPLSTDEVSKLWTALGGKFRPSAAYAATVVLIESTAPIQAPLPVTRPANIVTFQLSTPSVSSITPSTVVWTGAPITLTLTGSELGEADTVAMFGSDPSDTPSLTPAAPGGAAATVTVPAGLPAGVTTVQVVRQIPIGAPAAEATMNGASSNATPFTLQPAIRQGGGAPPNDYEIAIGAVTAAGTKPVTVTLDPALRAGQTVQLLLNELVAPGATPPSFTFDADPFADLVNAVTFQVPKTLAGAYLVRVAVDGGESLLVTAGSPPVFAYPAVTL